MKNFLTKREACEKLKDIEISERITQEDLSILTSIRVCIAFEEKGLSLWGQNIEQMRPLFTDCVIPGKDASEDVIDNYHTYRKCIEELLSKITIKE